MKQIQKNLCNHVVLAGFGRSGSKAAEELVGRGVPPTRLVVIDCSAEAAINAARTIGAAVVQGDASSNEVLSAVRIDRASALIVSAGRDDT